MGLLRNIKKKYYRFIIVKKAISVVGPLVANHKVSVKCNLYLGRNINFNGGTFEGAGEVHIGDNFYSGRNLRAMTTNHDIYSSRLPYAEKVVINKNIKIGDNVWLGDNVTLLPGANIGEGAVIQYGSVVTGSIPALSIAGGHPAKVFSKRDSSHYYKIKETMKKNNHYESI